MQCCQQCGLRPFLIDCASAHHHCAESRPFHQRSIKRRRTPLRGIGLFHVIHKIESQSFRSASIQRRKNSRLPIRRHLLYLLKSRFAQHLHHQLAAFIHPTIFRRDRWLLDPRPQPLHRFIVPLFNFTADGPAILLTEPCDRVPHHSQIPRNRRAQHIWHSQHGHCRSAGALQKLAPCGAFQLFHPRHRILLKYLASESVTAHSISPYFFSSNSFFNAFPLRNHGRSRRCIYPGNVRFLAINFSIHSRASCVFPCVFKNQA